MERNKEEAKRAFNIGILCFKGKNYEKSLKMFRISQRLDPSDTTKDFIHKVSYLIENKQNTTERKRTKSKASSHRNYDCKLDIVENVLKEKNHYKRLGVLKTSTAAEIKKSYRSLALQLHPDKNTHPNAENAFKAVSESFETLYDKDKRRSYDLSIEYGDDFTSNASPFTYRSGSSAFPREGNADIDELIRFMFFHPNSTSHTRHYTYNPRNVSSQQPPSNFIFLALLNILFFFILFLPVLTSK